VHQQLIEQLYRNYRDGLVRYLAVRFGRGPPDPEDIAQAAFVKLISSPVTDLVDPRAYIFTLASNLAIDQHRQVARQSGIDHAGVSDDVPAACSSEKIVMGWQRLALLEKALEAMPKLRRRIFLLTRIEGLPPREIARRFAISENAVHKHVSRALQDCAAALERAEQGSGERR
jgi:RNA polymerase sigma-70 factor (ECF subfamily)